MSYVAHDWLGEYQKRLDNPQISARLYRNNISPAIGELSTDRDTALDILGIIRKINESGRPTITNDALYYCATFHIDLLKC